MNNAIIGIDQSYTDTGLAIAARGKIQAAISLPLSKLENDIERRNTLRVKLHKAIGLCDVNGYQPIVYIEAVRINKGQTTFDYIKRAGAMESVIIDACYYANVECRSVASNSWKAGMLGSRDKVANSSGIAPEKYIAYQYTHKLGLDKYTMQPCTSRTKKYVYQLDNGTKMKYNDNIGDSCCIALYGSLPQDQQKYKVLLERRCDGKF